MVKYLKENFFVRYRQFDSFAHVNQVLEQWMADVADRRELRQFRQTPEQRFTQEQSHLQPLPDTDYQLLRHPSCLLGWLYRGWREPLQRAGKPVWPAGLNRDLAG